MQVTSLTGGCYLAAIDTAVVSAIIRAERHERVVEWLDAQEQSLLWITAAPVFEIRCGLELLPCGRRRHGLAERFDIVLQTYFASRLLTLDAKSAAEVTRAAAAAKQASGHHAVPDAMIAGSALARRARVATRNIAHFQHFGVKLVDPWTRLR